MIVEIVEINLPACGGDGAGDGGGADFFLPLPRTRLDFSATSLALVCFFCFGGMINCVLRIRCERLHIYANG